MLRFTKPPMVLETIRGFESFSVRFWKVVRVVEGAALEMLCARKCTVGSNPTSSVVRSCNGSTRDSGSLCPSSNLGRTIRLCTQVVNEGRL